MLPLTRSSLLETLFTTGIIMGLGESAALFAALLWTCSSMLWGRVRLSALEINVCKNVIATILIGLQMGAMFLWTGVPVFSASLPSWGWLAMSGIIGIVVGDTFYFRSLQILGPRLALMMATTSPIFSVLGGIWLGEAMGAAVLMGVFLTVTGVVVVVGDRRSRKEAGELYPGTRMAGIVCGVMGAICQAVGGVFSKLGMVDCEAIEATFIRILVSGALTIAWVSYRRQFGTLSGNAFKAKTLKLLIPATALGTWLGIWASQIAYKETDFVAVAQTLMSTCPLFAIPLVWYFHGQRISVLGVIGTVVAVLGVFYAVSS